jgi:hypothetical protein
MHFGEDIVVVWMGGKRGTGARDWGAKSGIDAARRRRSHRSCVPRFLLEFLLEFIFGSLSSGTHGRGIDGCTPPEATRAGGYPSTRGVPPPAPPRPITPPLLCLARRRQSYINIARKTCGRVRRARAEDPPARLIAHRGCFRDSGDCAVAFSFAIRRSVARDVHGELFSR